MEYTEVGVYAEPIKKKSKFNLRLFLAILTAAVVPVISDILCIVIRNLIASFQHTILDYLDNSIRYSFYVINILSDLTDLIFTPLSVLITAVICAILLKSFTKGVASYGYCYIVFSLRKIFPGLFGLAHSCLQLMIYNGNSSAFISNAIKICYGLSDIVTYGSYILCPVLIGLLFFLSEKIKSKKPDSKVKLAIKLVLTGLFPAAFFALQTAITFSQMFVLNYANSYSVNIYSVCYSLHSNISDTIISLFLLVGILIFIPAFRDGKTFALAVTYTAVPYNLLVTGFSLSSSICWLIDENFFNGYATEYIQMVMAVLLIIAFILITTISFVFIAVLPAVRARKKELDRIKKAEEEQKAEELEPLLDNVRYGEYSSDYEEYFYQETTENLTSV